MILHDRRRPLTWRQPSKRLPQETSLDTLSFDFGYGIWESRGPWHPAPRRDPLYLLQHTLWSRLWEHQTAQDKYRCMSSNEPIHSVCISALCVFVVTNENFVRRATAMRRRWVQRPAGDLAIVLGKACIIHGLQKVHRMFWLPSDPPSCN